MKRNLAIIIPAYKKLYFRKALMSIANQTCKDFTLYIGNDASPENLPEIVEDFTGLINIVYHRFENNLGAIDLTAQWARCLDLVGEEEWVWLFSDDDIMGPNCVENFYQQLNGDRFSDVFHIHLDIIDQNEKVIKNCQEYPEIFSAAEFFDQVFSGKIDARMPDFILNKAHLIRNGGIEKFDLAFRSDSATIMKLAWERGISSVPNALVQWRKSDESISSSVDQALTLRKVRATIDFFNWVDDFFLEHKVQCPISSFGRLRIVLENICSLIESRGFRSATRELERIAFVQKYPVLLPICVVFLFVQHKLYPNNRGL